MSLTTSRTTTCLLVSLLITSSSLTQAAPLFTKLQDASRVSVLVSPRSTVGSLSNAAEDGSATPGATAASSSPSSTPDDKVNKGNNVGAIVGGTVATGVILVILVFVWFAIRRQCLIQRGLKGKKGKKGKKRTTATEASSSSGTIPQKNQGERKERMKKTTSVSSLPPVPSSSQRPSPIRTQRDEGKDADSRSAIPSPLSSANSTTAQVGISDWDGPTVPSKAAHFLGLNQRAVLRPPTLASQPSAPPTIPPPARFDLPLQGTTIPKRRSSGCTMSTLGMELLRDVMQSPDIERFNTPPLAEHPWQPSHSRQQSRHEIPAQDVNGRCPSQVCFLPELSPTSPALNQGAFQSMGPVRKSADVQRPPRVVRRDTVRKDRFSMGSNKF